MQFAVGIKSTWELVDSTAENTENQKNIPNNIYMILDIINYFKKEISANWKKIWIDYNLNEEFFLFKV